MARIKGGRVLCFEVNPSKKEQQLDAMRKLVAGSEQKLAPVSGLERYMSVSRSHMSQFAKAAGCGQCCSHLEQLQPFTVEALQSSFQDEQFGKMVKEGWAWWIIQSDVEVAAPWFPQMLQAALNTGNHISKVATEVELAMFGVPLQDLRFYGDCPSGLCRNSSLDLP